MKYDKLIEDIKASGITQTFLYEQIDMSHTGYLKMIENKSMKVVTLEKICKLLGVSSATYLDDGDFFEGVSDNQGIVQNANGLIVKQLAKISKCEHEVEKLRVENELLRQNLDDVRQMAGLKGKS